MPAPARPSLEWVEVSLVSLLQPEIPAEHNLRTTCAEPAETEWLRRSAQALELAQLGQTAGAVELYAELGVAQRRAGALPRAIESYERALALDAARPELWVNLARALREAGRLPGAIAAFRRALELAPAANTWSMLSNALREASHDRDALNAVRTALTLDPWLAEAHLNEGAALHVLGDITGALPSYFVASRLAATRAPALANLRLALRMGPSRGDDSPIKALVVHLLEVPDDHASLCVLAQHLNQAARRAAAILCFEFALGHRPEPKVVLLLAQTLWDAGFCERAESTLLRYLRESASSPQPPHDIAVRVAAFRLLAAWFCDGSHKPSAATLATFEACPDDAVALAKLGGVAQRLGQPLRAARLYQRLACSRPEVVESHLYLGTVLTEQGDFAAANRAFERALELDPKRWDVFSSALFCSHLDPNSDERALFERHQAFGKRLAQSVPRRAPAPAVRAAPRKLRIGYVSPDFCAHPVSYFIEPVLRQHDARHFEVRCYSDVRQPDAVTGQLSRLVSDFVDCRGWAHERLSERIRADGVDILVDLAGHTANNRLPVFAHQPSPVQVAWLGYFDTTGLDTIGYRIADTHSVPAGAERLFTEHVVRLPRSANCYQPPRDSPEPAPPPCLDRGFVTFGCFNNPAKIGRGVCDVFARVLHAMPRSQLLLKYRSWSDAELRQRYLDWFAAAGISPERVLFEGSSAVPEFLAAFSRIDVALDPFPYSGETTALHTLWMGVPLVALEGPTLVQRLGSRVLRICGLSSWIASSPESYVEIALRLARDPELARVRATLRERLAASPLLDHRGVTRELEQAYRWMWERESRSAVRPAEFPT